MEIVEYSSKYKDKFIEYNTDWILDYFGFVEDEDKETFDNLEEYLKKGSMIYFAIDGDTLLAGCMVKKDSNDEWEICKLCSNKHVEHKGAGSSVLKKCMDYAVQNGAKRIYIITNSTLKAALHLYEKFGFKQIKLDDYHYERGDIAFEYLIGA